MSVTRTLQTVSGAIGTIEMPCCAAASKLIVLPLIKTMDRSFRFRRKRWKFSNEVPRYVTKLLSLRVKLLVDDFVDGATLSTD